MIFFIYFFGCGACGILVPQPGMEPMPPAVEAPNLNHWTAREVPPRDLLESFSVTSLETVGGKKTFKNSFIMEIFEHI